jgi:hypothetical protein
MSNLDIFVAETAKGFEVTVPNSVARGTFHSMHDGDQMSFDKYKVNQILAGLGLKKDPFFKKCPVTDAPIERGDYSTYCAYSNELVVRFFDLKNAQTFAALLH